MSFFASNDCTLEIYPLRSMGPPDFSARELTTNCTYQNIAPFTDFDGIVHQPGEQWRYLEHNFFPYDAGLTLYVERDGARGSIRLQDYPEMQGGIIDQFSKYVTKV